MKLTTASTRIPPDFRHNRLLQLLLLGYGALWFLAAVEPRHRGDWAMENLLVVSFIIALVGTYRVLPLSELTYLCITAFLTLHTIGSHYTYPEVPIGHWAQDRFGWSRNHYDRLVHFAFGLLMVYPMREIVLRVAGLRGFWTVYLPLEMTLALSAVYELIEWAAAALLAPEIGAAYLGAQGDEWDAHRDMLAALSGAVMGVSVTLAVRRLRGRTDTREADPRAPAR